MLVTGLTKLIGSAAQPARRHRPVHQPRPARFRPWAEALEDRWLPSTVNWVGGSGSWATASNWLDQTTMTHHVPTASDDAVINVTGITVTHGSGADSVRSLASLAATGSFVLSGGSLNVSTTVQVNNTLNLAGGTLNNATVVSGTAIRGTASGGTLSGVTLNGNLDLMTNNGAVVGVANGLTVNGTIFVGNTSGSTAGTVSFTTTQTIGGSGSILFGGSASNALTTPAQSGLQATVTFGANLTIHGARGALSHASASGQMVSYINQGTIAADVAGGTISVDFGNIPSGSSAGSNSGTMEALNGGTLSATTPANFAGGTLTGGTWEAFASSTLRVTLSSSIVTNAATIVLDGAGSNFYRNSGTTNALAGFATNNGSFTLADGRTFTTADNFANNGLLTVSAARFTVSGNFSQAAGGTLNIQLNGTSPGSGYGQLSVGGTATLAAGTTLNTTLGFVSNNGDTFNILQATNGVSGTFNGLAAGTAFVLNGERFRINYPAGSVVLTHFANVATRLNFTEPSTVTAGAVFPITVQALDGNNNVDTGYTDMVHFTATNGASANYTFTAGDQGQRTFNIVVYRAQTLGVTGTDTVTGITGTTAFTVVAGAAADFALSAPASVMAGTPFSVGVTVQDAYGNTVTGYTGTVHFTSSDLQAVLPADYTFATGDAGMHQFNGVILETSGNQTITAMDTVFNFLGNAAIAVMGATAYYVSPTGSDTNNGTSPSTPWQTIARVNQQVYGPGDSINFQGNASYSGSLLFGAQDAGTAANPITVTSYGTGTATIQAGTGVGILVQDTGGFTISNLDITGSGISTNLDYGIHVLDDLSTGTVFQHVYIDHVNVSGFGNYGLVLDCPSSTSGYQDIQITYSQLHGNLYGGMITFAPYYYNHSITTEFIQGFYMGHVDAYNNPGSASSPLPSGNGLLVAGVNGGLVERCEAHDNGGPNARGNVGGVYVANSTGVVVQYNEAYNNRTGTAEDGDGFDLDWDTISCTLQYNYSHDNDGVGFLLIGNNAFHQSYPPQTGNTVRYNISENDARKNNYGSISVVGPVDNAEVYNDTIYLSPASSGSPTCVAFYNWTGSSVHFRNNLFQVTGGLNLVNTNGTQVGTDLLFQGNDYYSSGTSFHINYDGVDYSSLTTWRTNTGQEQLNGSNVGFSVNPKLSDPGQGGTIGNADQLDTLTAYKLQSSSPVRNAGLDLMVLFDINPGTHDFFGHPIPDGSGFTIGADDEP
jgi:hypothetical protein